MSMQGSYARAGGPRGAALNSLGAGPAGTACLIKTGAGKASEESARSAWPRTSGL